MLKNNEDRIESMKSIVVRLTALKDKVDGFNCQKDPVCTPTGTLSQDQYEEALKPWISSFGRLSGEMVSGDDIAKVDNTTHQIIDEKDYVYKDLLKGPSGCEKELQDMSTGLPWQIYATKRMSYPMPILYDYNNFTNDEALPDPGGSGFTNKMPRTYWEGNSGSKIPINIVGPGFLSYVDFKSSLSKCKKYNDPSELPKAGYNLCVDEKSHLPTGPNAPSLFNYGLPIILNIDDDMFRLRDWCASVGQRPEDPGGCLSPGIFETMIGVW